MAVLTAWWVDHRRQMTARAELLEANRRLARDIETARDVLSGYHISLQLGGLWRDEAGPRN
jgi:hypothetical protein